MKAIARHITIDEALNRAKPLVRLAADTVAETLWPTRCALCDTPGAVLCDRCERALPYVDQWRACPRCGAAYGLRQCCACSAISLGHINRTSWPFDACVSSVMFGDEAGRIVRTYKDLGEQRLAGDMARIMARTLPPAWDFDAIAFIPASKAAYQRRGFDHGQLLAESLCRQTGSPLCCALQRPRAADQRALGRSQRVSNLEGRFAVKEGKRPPKRLLLIDDVFTTGSTLCSACDALRESGVQTLYCATFARVY